MLTPGATRGCTARPPRPGSRAGATGGETDRRHPRVRLRAGMTCRSPWASSRCFGGATTGPGSIRLHVDARGRQVRERRLRVGRRTDHRGGMPPAGPRPAWRNRSGARNWCHWRQDDVRGPRHRDRRQDWAAAVFLSPNVAGAGCAATWTIVKPKTPTRPRASMAMWIRRTGIPPLVVETAGQRGGIFPRNRPPIARRRHRLPSPTGPAYSPVVSERTSNSRPVPTTAYPCLLLTAYWILLAHSSPASAATASLTSIPLCRLNSMSRLNTSATSSAMAARAAGRGTRSRTPPRSASGTAPAAPRPRRPGPWRGSWACGTAPSWRAAAKAPAASFNAPTVVVASAMRFHFRRSPGRVALDRLPRRGRRPKRRASITGGRELSTRNGGRGRAHRPENLRRLRHFLTPRW